MSSDAKPADNPTLYYYPIDPIRDPATLGLDAEELSGARKRMRRVFLDLVRDYGGVDASRLVELAEADVSEFAFLGPDYGVLRCAFIHVQVHDCGERMPTQADRPCAFARALIDLGTASEQLQMGGLSRVALEASELAPRVEAFVQTVVKEVRFERDEKGYATFPLSREACVDGDRLYNGAVAFGALLSRHLSRWWVAAPDALDLGARSALSRAESALTVLGFEPAEVAEIVRDLRGRSRPANKTRSRLRVDRPHLLIRARQ